jgi:hypothetical protein
MQIILKAKILIENGILRWGYYDTKSSYAYKKIKVTWLYLCHQNIILLLWISQHPFINYENDLRSTCFSLIKIKLTKKLEY